MSDDEQQIRALIERWADAVHGGDLDGDDVAYALALLRCGTQQELADNPDNRLRLTLGLRRTDGRWVVTHEHHSFPDLSPEAETGA